MEALGSAGKEVVAVLQCRCGVLEQASPSGWWRLCLSLYPKPSGRKFVGETWNRLSVFQPVTAGEVL